MDPVHSFIFEILQTNIIFHTIRLIFCFQQADEIDNLTVKLGQSSLIVFCRFHVGTGITGVAPHYTPSPTTFRSDFDLLLVRLNLGFILRENLLLYSSYLPLGVFNECVSFASSSTFSGAVAGEVKPSVRGVSHFKSLYFVIVLLSLFFILSCLLSLLKKNTKN